MCLTFCYKCIGNLNINFGYSCKRRFEMCRLLIALSQAVNFKCGCLDLTTQWVDKFVNFLTDYGVIGTTCWRRNTYTEYYSGRRSFMVFAGVSCCWKFLFELKPHIKCSPVFYSIPLWTVMTYNLSILRTVECSISTCMLHEPEKRNWCDSHILTRSF